MTRRALAYLLAFLAVGSLRAEVKVLNGALVFTNLTADTVYALPDAGATYARIASYDNHGVTLNGGPLTLTGGATELDAAVENRAPTNYSSYVTFNVPVRLTNADAAGGVGCLFAGGCVFNRSITLENSTKPLDIRRVRASGVRFYSGSGTATTSDFSRAESVTLGVVGKDSSGVVLAAYTNTQVNLPDVIVAKSSSLQANGEDAVVTAGDVSFVDPAYYSNGKFTYSTLSFGYRSRLVCRNLVQRPGSGSQFTFGTSTRVEAASVELHSSASPAANVWSCTFHTPDFNVRGSVPALVSSTVTFDVSAITTRVGRLSFDPAKTTGVSVTGTGAIEFVGETALPKLTMGNNAALLFDAVEEGRPLLRLDALSLPAAKCAKICVRNRMLSGKVALATGVSAAQLANMTVEISPYASLSVVDGVLVYAIEGVDLSQPATATWVGAGNRARMDDPANWACADANGTPMPGRIPTAATDVRVSGETSFNCPPDAAFPGGALSVCGKVVLSDDCDWRGLPFGALEEGVTVDLNGHRLQLALEGDAGDRRMTLTDSSSEADTPGEVVVEVGKRKLAAMRRTAFSGNLRLVKTGGGTLAVSSSRCFFTGGERVGDGRIAHVGDAIGYEEFGAVGDGVADDMPAIVETHDCANALDVPVRARDGATYYIGGKDLSATVNTDVDFGTAKFTVDDTNVENCQANLFNVVSRQPAYVVTGVSTLSVGQRNIGRTLPCKSLVYVVDSKIKLFKRSGDNANTGANQQEPLLVDAEGNVDGRAPVTWNYPEITEMTAFPVDERTLTIRGGEFTTIANRNGAKVYYNRGFNINRSNVRIEGLKHYVKNEPKLSGSVKSSPYSGFVSALKCANVAVSNCVFTGLTNYDVAGTYDLRGNNAVNLRFEHCTQSNDILDSTFWGILGSNFCKLLAYDHCSLSRFDAHQGMYHAKITDSVIGINGVNAIGYGVLLLENSTVYADRLVNLRDDYGSFWRGEFVVRNCKFVPNGGKSATGVLLRGANDGKHDYGYDCMMPWRVTIDGLEIDDSKHPTGYKGPYVFANFNSKKTSSSYKETYPYAITEKVVLHNVTTKSGKSLQRSANTYMFKDVEIVNDLPTDIGFEVGAPVIGWNWTNETISAEVTRLDPAVKNGQLKLEIRDGLGHVIRETTKSVTGLGTVDFDVDLPVGGTAYDYSIVALDGGRPLCFASSAESRGVFAGRMDVAPFDGFSASVRDGQEILTNGTWQVAPTVETAPDRFDVKGLSSFRIARPTANRLLRVDVRSVVEGFTSPSDLSDRDAIGLSASHETTGFLEDRGRWMALRPEADGRMWFPLYGDEPEIGREYVVRIEYDRVADPPRVRYSVRAADEPDFTVLSDAGGVVWHLSSLSDARAISGLAFVGNNSLTDFRGVSGDAVVAETDGRSFVDLNEAIAVAVQKKTPVTLLVDVSFVPNGSTGEVRIDAGGRRLRWQDGSDSALAHDPKTGLFRLIPLSGGKCPNGLDSYSSYALGLNAADPGSKPLLSFSRQADGSVALTLNVDPPAEFAGRLAYRLEESASVTFEDPQFLTSDDPVFKIGFGEAPQRFYRVYIDIP